MGGGGCFISCCFRWRKLEPALQERACVLFSSTHWSDNFIGSCSCSDRISRVVAFTGNDLEVEGLGGLLYGVGHVLDVG